MSELWIAISSSLWLGILTSISPCPLASNIAAISLISYQIANRLGALSAGIFYGLGRSLVYILLSGFIIKLSLNISIVSEFLQRYINQALGIILILVGMFLLNLFNFNLPSFKPPERLSKKLTESGILGAFLLGGLFALAFCPVSAALFFGGLLPISIKQQSVLTMPLLYGLGSALPVLAFSGVISMSSQLVSKFYQNLSRIEFYAKRITGGIFILVGIYYVLAYIFKIL